MASLFSGGKFQAINADGPVPGALLHTYAAGTGTATPLATYTLQDGVSANTNPVECDEKGQASVWLGTAAYHMVLTDADGVTIWDVDNIDGVSDSADIAFAQDDDDAVTRTVESKLRDTVNVRDFGAVGDGVTDDTDAFNAALQATLPFADVVKRQVYVPEGEFKITDRLFVRAGCSLIGAGGTASHIVMTGLASTDVCISLGWGNISGTPTNDSSGLCPVVEGLFITGTGVAIDTTGQAGWKVRDCWWSCTVGMIVGGADGTVDKCVVDTSTPVGMVLTGSRIGISNCHFVNPNFGIQINPPEFAKVDGITIEGCHFFACAFGSIYAYATAVIGQITIDGCQFHTSTTVGVRQSDQRHFFTQTGATFEFLRFVGCSFSSVKQNDIEIASGVGILRLVGCDFNMTGIADGGASYASATSINITSACTLIARDCDFNLVGGQSIRINNATAKARISNCHNIGCGTGGTGLSASANEGDKAHIHFTGGCSDIVVSDCSGDAATLYVVGAFNTSYYHGRHNKSAAGYDTHQVIAGGTNFGERTNGGTMVPSVVAATALTLPAQGSENPVFLITGNTAITSIVTTGWAGRRVTLIFSGTPTFTDGSNLKLAGNLVATADDTISLVCDGTNFYEIGRAVN